MQTKPNFATAKTVLMSLMLALTIFCFAITFVLAIPTTTANAYTTDPTPTVTEIYTDSESGGSFNQANLQVLLQKLAGKSDTVTLANLKSQLNLNTTGVSVVNGSNEIVVEFGGIKWIAVYLTLADTGNGIGLNGNIPNNGDVILTLWQASATDTAVWNTYSENEDVDYPANMYSTSEIRTKTLNNGGSYTTDGSDLTMVVQDDTNTYAKFNMSKFTSDSITNRSNINQYLVAPRYLSWQKKQSTSMFGWSYARGNEAWGALGEDAYLDVSFCYESKDHYTDWMDDLVWLPSITEIGDKNVAGLWKTTSQQKEIDGDFCWLRSSSYSFFHGAHCLRTSEADRTRLNVVNSDYLVRPALHLNLSAAVGETIHTEHTLEWKDDGAGNHYQQCTAENCGYQTSPQAHNVEYGTSLNQSQHKGYCTVCRLEVTENHTPTGEFTSESNHDLNGHWQTCSICNSRVNEATHEWGSDWKDAGDYHSQTCETCTQEYRQEHAFSSWTTAGETDHTRKCADCQKEETLAHVVGEVFYNDGEGNHYKKCQDCDAEIEKQSHNYNGKYYDDGKGNHYQICEDCNYTTEYTPHSVTSWSSNGSETHQGQCETCQLTVVASHDWADTKTFDDYGHWYKCNAQGCEAKNEYHEHVVSTWTDFKDEANHKGNCDECDKQDITAPHILGKLQQDEEGYYQECTVCKYKVEYSDVGENHEHDYSELCYDEVSHWYRCECGVLQNVKPHDNSEWKFEGKSHYKYCETCKQKYLNDEHSLIKYTGYEETCNATGLKDYWECRVCNSYFTDEGVTRITMDINTWLEREEQSGGGIIPSNSAKHQYDQVNFKSNETGHWYECTVCGEKLGSIANHVDVDNWTDNGDGRHYKTCQYCNYVTKYESHNGANWHTDGNQTHTGTCLDCGATVTQSHDWNNTFTYDEYTHWYACKATGCTERKAETAHVGKNWQNVGNSTYHEGICDCGYAHVKQNHTLTWETYQDSYRQECKICGYADDSSVTDHVFTNWEYLNEEEHQSHCDIPNHEDIQTSAHVWETKYDQTSHWQVCKDCGYEKDNSRTVHVLTSGTQNHDETHTGTCTVCGAEGIRQDHVWSEDWVVGEDSHWRECAICGAHVDESAHNVTEFTTDGEHTHSGECTVCGKHFEKEHTWLFGFCTECPDQLKNYSEADIGIAATAIVAQLFALIAVAAIISRRIKR